MSKVEKFEDLIAWQKARELTKMVYSHTGNGTFAKDYGLKDQIRRACVSIMSNIAEGFERGTQAEFHQFLVIAKASCAEVRSQLYIANDVGHLNNKIFKEIMAIATEVSKIIGGLRASVQRNRDKTKT